MGSVAAYETTAGRRYRVIYRKPDHIQTQKRGFRTKHDAELFLAKVEIDKSRGAYVDPAKSRVLLGEWLDAWMASRSDWRETSRERVRGIVVRHIKPELGGYPLASLNHQLVQNWAGALVEDSRTGERSQDRQRPLWSTADGCQGWTAASEPGARLESAESLEGIEALSHA